MQYPTYSPFLVAVTDVTSSGSDVPKAIIVKLIIFSLIPIIVAIAEAESTTKLLPIIIAIINNYILYFDVDFVIDNESDYGDYITVDVCFSRKGKEHLNYFNEPIDYKNTEICKYVEDVIGISEFTCYYTEFFKDDEDDDELYFKRYSFIPKKIEQRIRQF